MAEVSALGPVQLLVVGFENPELHGRIYEELERLRASDTIRVLDSVVVLKDVNGDVSLIPQSEMSTEEAGAYVSALIGLGTDEETNGAGAGANGRLLNDVQVWYAADSIPSGTMAGVALIEHRWAIPLRSAIVESGGEVLADAWIHPVDLVEVGLLAGEPATV